MWIYTKGRILKCESFRINFEGNTLVEGLAQQQDGLKWVMLTDYIPYEDSLKVIVGIKRAIQKGENIHNIDL